jgi:uncharacterized protein YdaL
VLLKAMAENNMKNIFGFSKDRISKPAMKIALVLLMIQFTACTKQSDIQTSEEQRNQQQDVNAGLCGTTNATCLVGSVAEQEDTDTQYKWTCTGINGSPNADCAVNKPVAGTCGTDINMCTAGLFSDTKDTETVYNWSCKGNYGGADAACTLPRPPPEESCVQIFYDKTGENADLARSDALMIVNLMGHFPQHQSILGPVELYKKGDLDRCAASFYVGMTMDNPLPADFLADYKTTTKTVVWMGYNFWELGSAFETTFGYKTYQLNNLDTAHKTPPPDNKPSFFRDVLYKGEVWSKYNVFLKNGTLDGAFEMIKLTGKTSDVATELAQVRHSYTNEVIPWALQSGRKFWLAEVPLSYFHEADRYFVFADLMFDFLQEEPRHDGKYAFLRLEDVGPMEEVKNMDEAVDILTRNGVPVHFNMYPIFNDPLNAVTGHAGTPMIRMENASANYKNAIQRYIQGGATIIWHGVTHQYSNIKNPYSGASGDDYEFWNSNTNSPIAEDSVNYVLDKMEDGFKSFKTQNIEPHLWTIPHYEASALDNVMFGQMFPWMVSRGVYIDNKISGLKEQDPAKSIYWSIANTDETNKNRRDFFAGLSVQANQNIRFGQIFPYELYGDLYSQHVIPEDLGNVEPVLSQQVEFVRTVDTILQDAKRNLVLRDVWGSVFYHPYLLDPKENSANKDPNQPKDLEKLVAGMKSMGYNFINLNTWVDEHKEPLGKPRIELEDIR